MSRVELRPHRVYAFILGALLLALLAVGASFTLRMGILQRALPALFTSPADPGKRWSVQASDAALVTNRARVPIYQWFPDGHISSLPDGAGGWVVYWAEYESYRTTGSSPFPEDQVALDPLIKVFGARGGKAWDNGGSWLTSVYRLDGKNLLAFYHAEDHWTVPNPDYKAWKSIAVTYSGDDGVTWAKGQQIITAWKSRPAEPAWGGAGDQGIVWDSANARWVCFYQELADVGEAQIHMAASSDPRGKPGSWFKWDGSHFSAPGLGGKGAPLPAFLGYEGANPSIHWNTYLQQWVMIYGGWDGSLYITSSADLIRWAVPRVLVRPEQKGGHAWYPTIISAQGDTTAGESAYLYYADIAPSASARKFYRSALTFTRSQ
jgi:hypothetical protein